MQDSDGRYVVPQQAINDLHLSDEQVIQLSTMPLVDIIQNATNTYEVLSHALPGSVATVVTSPTLDDDGNPTYNEAGEQIFHSTTTTEYFDWKLVDTNAYPGYVDGTSSQWDHQYKMLTTDIEFTVIGKIGNETLPGVFGDDAEGDFRFGATIDNQDKGSVSIAQAAISSSPHRLTVRLALSLVPFLPMMKMAILSSITSSTRASRILMTTTSLLTIIPLPQTTAAILRLRM